MLRQRLLAIKSHKANIIENIVLDIFRHLKRGRVLITYHFYKQYLLSTLKGVPHTIATFVHPSITFTMQPACLHDRITRISKEMITACAEEHRANNCINGRVLLYYIAHNLRFPGTKRDEKYIHHHKIPCVIIHLHKKEEGASAK